MKLSEAIRLGAMLRRQEYGPSTDEGTCALNAALEAIGERLSNGGACYHPTLHNWPWTSKAVTCPGCGIPDRAYVVATKLNDDHRWTREQIADWIATIEPTETPEVTPDAVEVQVA